MDRMFCINCKDFRQVLRYGNLLKCVCGTPIALLYTPKFGKHQPPKTNAISKGMETKKEARLQQSSKSKRPAESDSKLGASGKIRKILPGMSRRERRDIRKANKAIKQARRRAKKS